MGPRRALLTLADRERRKSDWRDARDAGGHETRGHETRGHETRGHETRALLYDSSHTTHAGVLVRSYARLLSSPNSLDSSSGSSVAARATRSSAFLFVMDRNMQVSACADNIGAAHPRAVRTGDRVSRRPARTESNSNPPNGYTDTTRERQDAQKMAPVCVFFDVFMFSRRANVSAASRDGARRRDCRDWHFSRCAPLEGPRASKSAAGVGAGAALLSARRENVPTQLSCCGEMYT